MENISKNSNPVHERKNTIQKQNPKRKTYEELTLMDSFLFESATEKPENALTISKVIIERTIGRKFRKLVVGTQKDLKGININKHGIRMDVYTTEVDETTDDNETTCVYDIEPNNYREDDIPRRNRYYQSLIDCKLLPANTPYERLPDMFSIWILPYDPFGDDRMLYTVKNKVEENNQIVYNDGVTKIFLYTKGTKGGSHKLKEFLTFMENPCRDNAVDNELLEILDIIDTVKADPKERERYMGIMGVIDYEKRDAEIKGAIEAYKLINMNREQTKDAIMKQFSIPEDWAEDCLNLYW